MSELAGHQIQTSTVIQGLIKQLTQEVGRLESEITEPRAPNAAFEKKSQSLVELQGALRGRPLFYPYVGTGAGNGPYVELEDGSVKLDLINGIGIHVLGHGHPRLTEAALRGALCDIVMQGHLQANKEYLRFNEKILELAGKKSRLKHCWISTCGTMANENALKITRQKNTPARMVLAFNDGFAGRSTMMAEITDNPDYKVGLPSYNEVLRLPFYDAKNPTSSTEKTLTVLREHLAKHPKNISALWFEPMQGEGGFWWAPREFYKPIFEICKANQIAVWADEVQTFCRTGEMFAFETLDIGEFVDVCTIAKTAKVGATLYTPEYNPKPGLIAGTFAGSSVSLSVGREVLDILSTEGYTGKSGKIQQIHQEFVGMLNELNSTTCQGLLQDAGGLGLMVAVTPFDGSKEKVNQLLKSLFNNGLMCFNCGHSPYRLRFLIPAVIQSKDIQIAKKIIEKSIFECK